MTVELAPKVSASTTPLQFTTRPVGYNKVIHCLCMPEVNLKYEIVL